jgi:ABC-2 type transport system permease protein
VNSALVVARKDFEDAVRSRGVLFVSVLFVGLFVVGAYLFGDAVSTAPGAGNVAGNAPAGGSGGAVTTNPFLRNSVLVTTLLVPLVALVASYRSVVGERTSGTLKLLLSLPHSRRDVVLGKLLGRTAVVTLPAAAALLLAIPVFLALGVAVEPLPYLGFVLLTALFGAVFVALAIGVSAAVSTDQRAVLGTVGSYLFLLVLWGPVVGRLAREIRTRFGMEAFLEASVVLRVVNPLGAYRSLVTALTVDSAAVARGGAFGRFQVGGSGGLVRALAVQQLESTGVPAYLSDPAVAAYLLCWGAVPVVVGYLLFRRADL